MLDFLNSVFLPSVDHHPRKAGSMLRKFLHESESSSSKASKVKRGGMKLESIIPLLDEGILSSSCCCEDEEKGSRSGMRRVKIWMGKEAAARLLSNCTTSESDGPVLQFNNLTTNTPLPLLSNFKTKYD